MSCLKVHGGTSCIGKRALSGSFAGVRKQALKTIKRMSLTDSEIGCKLRRNPLQRGQGTAPMKRVSTRRLRLISLATAMAVSSIGCGDGPPPVTFTSKAKAEFQKENIQRWTAELQQFGEGESLDVRKF